MPQFETSTYYSQLFWLVIVFGFLYIVISKLVVPAAKQILGDRKNNIETSIKQAEQYTLEAKNLNAQADQLTKEANIMAQKIKNDIIDSMRVLFNSQKVLIDQELKEKSAESIKEIKQTEEEFLNEQAEACIDLAKYIITKITGNDVDMTLLTKCYRRIK